MDKSNPIITVSIKENTTGDRKVCSPRVLPVATINSCVVQTTQPVCGGTPGYMFPEHGATRHFTNSSDLYALGGILYFLLTGNNPSSFQEILMDEAKLVEGLPVEIHSFFKKGMALKPKDRFRSVEEFCTALNTVEFPE